MLLSELSAPTSIVSARPTATLPWKTAVGLGAFCALFGVFSFYNSALWLAEIWRTDDLKSVGMLVPWISFFLILRAWRSIGWTTRGTWWGFALLASTALLVFLRDQTMLVLTVGKDWLVQLPPVPLLAILYALGMVLLFGGMPLLRAARFPVLFMGAVLPVPETFSRVVDLPLQHASATVARGFAHLLGERLTPDNLRLMFTPDFGMFIAPGCNGIRGAVTLGLAAVVLAYVYRFRWTVFAPVVLGAVLLGYVFNFVRLCLLVVYYKLALPYPWFQDRAKGADYLIGGGLFVLALYLFFALADRLKRKGDETRGRDASASASIPVEPFRPAAPLLLKASAVVVLALVFGVDDMRAAHRAGETTAAIPPMPESLGGWQRVRAYQDTLTTGVVVYTWGDYTSPDGKQTVSVGVSPALDMHDVEVCHIARGEAPLWRGHIVAPTPSGESAFVAATYNDGLQQTLEASTLCDAASCRQYTEATGHMTFVYAHPRRVLPLPTDTGRPVPMLLKVQSRDVAAPPDLAGQQMAGQLRDFLRNVDLEGLAGRFRAPARP